MNAAAHVTYVIVSGYALAPVVQKFELSYKDPDFNFGKFAGFEPADLSVQLGSDRMPRIEQKLTKSRDNGGTHADYTLQITPCNPKCA